MKYTSEQTLRSVFEHLDHADPARRRVAAAELLKRRQRPEALLVLRVARASEVDEGLAAELARQLDEALATCGIKAADSDSSGRINVGKLEERLSQGDLPHKLRALELLTWFPLPQAFAMLGERLAGEGTPPALAADSLRAGESVRSTRAPVHDGAASHGLTGASGSERGAGRSPASISRLAGEGTPPGLAPASLRAGEPVRDTGASVQDRAASPGLAGASASERGAGRSPASISRLAGEGTPPALAADSLRAGEPDEWVRAAIVVVIAELGGPAASGLLQRLAAGDSRAARCARFALAKLKPASKAGGPLPAPAPEAPAAPSPPGPAPADAAEDNGAIACPMCQAAVALSRRTMGDLVTCPRCGMGFRLTLERGGADEPPQVGTQAASSSEIVPPGSRVQSLYEILGELGRGGQGAVYRVRPKDGKKDFALKYLDSSIPVSSNQLLANQDIASLLDHPNIVSVFATGVDEPDRRTFAVYEIVEGRSLSALLKDGPLPVEKAIDIAFQVLGGLAHSHAQGVVHRDLKPDNILVTHGGIAKIADFGIGILVGDREKLNASDQPFVGTPGYAAPEQITGWGAVRASDVYAIGMTLYEMLAGRLPFPAPTLEILLHHQVSTAPRPPSAFRPGIPAQIEAVVMTCLEKSPARRPAWAGELFEKLRAAARSAGFEVPLAASFGQPEPRRIDSVSGLAAAWPALLVGSVVFAGPIAAITVAPLRKLIASLFEVMMIAWIAALVAFTRYARKASGGRAPDSTFAHLFGNFTGSSRGGFGVIPVIVLAPMLMRVMIEGDRIDSLHVFVPIAVVLAVIALMPTWSGWMEKLLADPAEAHLERGISVLKLEGPRGWSCQVDGGPASRLPCRVLLKEGPHHLVVSGDGQTQRFSLQVGAASMLSTRLSLSGTTIVDREGEHEAPPPGVLIHWLGSPLFVGVAAIVCTLGALAIAAQVVGRMVAD